MLQDISLALLEYWSYSIYDLILVIGVVLFSLEMIVGVLRRKLRKLELLDSITSFSTLIPYGFTEALMVVVALYAYLGLWEHVTPYQLPVNGWVVLLAVVLADLAYYWAHRFAHEVRLLWVAHSVHHSSTIFNTAVAFRFSPLIPLLRRSSMRRLCCWEFTRCCSLLSS